MKLFAALVLLLAQAFPAVKAIDPVPYPPEGTGAGYTSTFDFTHIYGTTRGASWTGGAYSEEVFVSDGDNLRIRISWGAVSATNYATWAIGFADASTVLSDPDTIVYGWLSDAGNQEICELGCSGIPILSTNVISICINSGVMYLGEDNCSSDTGEAPTYPLRIAFLWYDGGYESVVGPDFAISPDVEIIYGAATNPVTWVDLENARYP